MPACPRRSRDMDVWLGIVLGDVISCARKGIMIMTEGRCDCTNIQPPPDMQISDEKCDKKCRDAGDSCCGYDVEGRQNVYSIYYTGLPRDNDMHDDEESSVSSSTVGPETTTWISPSLSNTIDLVNETNRFTGF